MIFDSLIELTDDLKDARKRARVLREKNKKLSAELRRAREALKEIRVMEWPRCRVDKVAARGLGEE